MDWDTIIAAGVSLAGGLLKDDEKDRARADTRETQILNLQDNERGRQAQADRLQDTLASNLQIAQLGQETSLENTRKKILGDVLLQQGQGQEKLMLESFRSSANTPERFNTAANILSQVLSR